MADVEKAERKPLDAQFVGKTNAAALKALADNGARRKWPDSPHGSPLTTNMLCAEIARLNIAQEAMVGALRSIEFRGHQGKCPLCAGWDMSPSGETPGKHTKDCAINLALTQAGAA